MKNTRNIAAILVFAITGLLSKPAIAAAPPSDGIAVVKVLKKEKNNRVHLNLLNLDENPVQIVIRDGMGRKIHTETILKEKSIHKSFNFNKAYSGTYDIQVKDGKTIYSLEIELY